MASTIAPITGMLRRNLVLDLSTAFGESRSVAVKPYPNLGFGTTFGYLWWYGYHLPRVRARDNYYARLEQDRAAGKV
ncbi:hypothetical protein BJX63DRAFT_431572 [Aspergillus granulosus]|uniref:Cytochrome c oxidase polypeptide VIIA n=1 Tax=Aspergillus granulosus TaxID=176169 RepID=A0ABR4HFA2_9EURO